MLSLALMIFVFLDASGDNMWLEECGGFSIEVHFPEIAFENEEIGNLLREFAADEISLFKDHFRNYVMEEFDTSEWSLELNIVQEPSPVGLACITARQRQYTGGAHGNTMIRSFVFDLDSSSEIGVVELLGGEEEFQAFAKAVIEELKGTQVDETWVERGASADLQNYRTVYPVPSETGEISGYTVLFPPYQVACYACGTIEVFIPAD